MYNPINNEVEDELRLQERQTREKNAKKRYETKYQAEAKVQYESQED